MQQPQQQETTTIAQKIQIGANIAYTISFPVMVLLRRKLGYRFISQPRLIISALIFWVAAILAAGVSTQQPTYYSESVSSTATASLENNAWLILLFTVAFLIWGLLQRWLRWRDIKMGIAWHTHSRGMSWFAFLPLSDSKVKRFVDPAMVLAVGLLLSLTHLQSLLGDYLIIAAACLFAWEAYDYQRSLDMMLDQLDSLVESEVMASNMEYYQQADPQQRPLDQTAGIPTGIAPDIQHQIDQRKARRGTGTSTGTLPNNGVPFPIAGSPNGPTPGTVI